MRSRVSHQYDGNLVLGCLGMVLAAFFFVAVPTIKALGGANIEYSEGTRSGTVQKLSKKGFFWKTWEGELNLGYAKSVSNGDGRTSIAPAIWHFSVSDEQVASELTEAEKSGVRVTLSYKQYLMRGYDKGGTDYDVTAVLSD